MFDPEHWFAAPGAPSRCFDKVKLRACLWAAVWSLFFFVTGMVEYPDSSLLYFALSSVVPAIFVLLWFSMQEKPVDPALMAAIPESANAACRQYSRVAKAGVALCVVLALWIHPGGMLFLLFALTWGLIFGLLSLNAHLKGLDAAKKIAQTSYTFMDGSLKERLFRLDPRQFQALVGALMKRMGYLVQVTRQSRGGVGELLLEDATPVRGGRIVVHTHHSPTVRLDDLRALYGAVTTQGAHKGVLVTSGHFEEGATAWIAGKPLELMDGEQVTALLDHHRNKR